MIILFDEYETNFETLGLGVLSDATKCEVSEGLNDTFELKMSYDIRKPLYKEIRVNRILYCKPNPFEEAQPFRIDGISRPINNIVEITAKHLSYDTNALPIKAIKATDLNTLIEALNNEDNCFVKNKFKFRAHFSSAKTYETKQIFNLRSILMGDDEESLLGVYNAEVKFDRFNIDIYTKRGQNRGAAVRYGHNMTDLKHETTTERLYNGVLPYYHKESETTESTGIEEFPKGYIVGTKPFMDGWLSFSEGGDPYHPIDTSPIQIATEGDYKDFVYCWNPTYQKYEQKIYNESITLIQNITTPGWVRIDWKSFPTIKIVANAKGYYKMSTDETWGDLKGPGDPIYEGNVLKEGISGLATNMMLYFSEVIPSSSTATTTEVSNIVDIRLDEPIIWLNTLDAKTMTHDRILLLDLTSEFEDGEPSQQQLKTKAEEYISKNEVGSLYINTTVSFINLPEDVYQGFDHVELGDTVRIVHEDANIDTELRVISTNYNVLTDQYISVELGKKADTMSSTSIQNGDSISSLTNDAGYADITTVNKLIADIVTANYINAANATLSKAQIEELEVAKINVPGIIEASQYSIDNLVAKLLTADNAVIKQKLEAGEISVKGNIDIINGSISLGDDQDNTFFKVDNKGNVTANSVDITGGRLNIGDQFQVDIYGNVMASSLAIEGGTINIADKFSVTVDGVVTCRDINILTDDLEYDGENGLQVKNIKQLYTDGECVYDKIVTKDIEIGDNYTTAHMTFESDSMYEWKNYVLFSSYNHMTGITWYRNNNNVMLKYSVSTDTPATISPDILDTTDRSSSQLNHPGKNINVNYYYVNQIDSEKINTPDREISLIPDQDGDAYINDEYETPVFDENAIITEVSNNPINNVFMRTIVPGTNPLINLMDYYTEVDQISVRIAGTAYWFNRVSCDFDNNIFKWVETDGYEIYTHSFRPKVGDIVYDEDDQQESTVLLTDYKAWSRGQFKYSDYEYEDCIFYYNADGVSTITIPFTITNPGKVHITLDCFGFRSMAEYGYLDVEIKKGSNLLYENTIDSRELINHIQVTDAGNYTIKLSAHKYAESHIYRPSSACFVLKMFEWRDENEYDIPVVWNMDDEPGLPMGCTNAPINADTIVELNYVPGTLYPEINPKGQADNRFYQNSTHGYILATKKGYKINNDCYKLRSGQVNLRDTSWSAAYVQFSIIHEYKEDENRNSVWFEPPEYLLYSPAVSDNYLNTGRPAFVFGSDIVPSEDGEYTLGLSDRKWKEVYADNGTIQTSDRRLKDDINYDIAKFSDVFDKLKPVSYRLKSDPTKVHTGLIAQDIEAVLDEYNLDDYALLNKQKDSYGLSYTEVIAMLVYEVQKLKEKSK